MISSSSILGEHSHQQHSQRKQQTTTGKQSILLTASILSNNSGSTQAGSILLKTQPATTTSTGPQAMKSYGKNLSPQVQQRRTHLQSKDSSINSVKHAELSPNQGISYPRDNTNNVNSGILLTSAVKSQTLRLAPSINTSQKKPRKTVRIVEIEMDHNEITNATEEFESS